MVATTMHCSAPDIARLIEAAEKVRVRRPNTFLRIAARANTPTIAKFRRCGEGGPRVTV
jgi:hypothetical protein